MIHIERDFYTPALKKALAEDTPEEQEQFKQMLLEYEETRECRDKMGCPVKVLDQEKLKWFENLAGATIEFAQSLELKLLMTVQDNLYGYIRFETSYFELDDRDGPLPLAFWVLLFENADRTSISLCEEVFRIELFFDLYRFEENER